MVKISIKQALTLAINQYSLTKLDAEIILAFVLNATRTYLATWDETILTSQQYGAFITLIKQRQKNIPVAYLIGSQQFWSLDLMVNENVLIPRGDTEILVTQAIKLIAEHNYRTILDLGTGSGAISLAIAKEYPTVNIVAVDNSESALQIAQQNYHNLKLSNIEFLLSDWFENITQKFAQKFDLIVSNPPYIAAGDSHLEDLKFEPVQALVAADDGLADIKLIIENSLQFLNENGVLLIEHGYNQAQLVCDIFKQFNFSGITTIKDFAGNARNTFGFTIDY